MIVHLDLSGNTLGVITLPTDPSSGFFSPEGFALDPRDASFWVPLVNSGVVVHVDQTGTVLGSYPVGGNPNDAAVGPDGDIYVTQPGANIVQKLDPGTGIVTTFLSGMNLPINLHWTADATLWVGNLFTGPQLYDLSGNLLQTIFDVGVVSAESDIPGNVWDTNVFSLTANRFDPNGNLQFSTPITAFQPGLAVLGGDNFGAPALVTDSNDDYSFQLTAGQSATLAITGITGGHAHFDLEDGNGTVLALSGAGGSGVDSSIENFVARTTGTYYVVITGDSGAQYSLVVTRGSTFDTAPNGNFASAQELDATHNALGAITPGKPIVFALDDNVLGGPSTIYRVDPDTGALSHPIPAPNPEANNPFGLNMAFDGTYLYYNDGANFGDNTIYKLDPSTGAVLASFVPPPSVPLLTGLAWYKGDLYGVDGQDNHIFVFDATSFQLIATYGHGHRRLVPRRPGRRPGPRRPVGDRPDRGHRGNLRHRPGHGPGPQVRPRPERGPVRAGHRLPGRRDPRLRHQRPGRLRRRQRAGRVRRHHPGLPEAGAGARPRVPLRPRRRRPGRPDQQRGLVPVQGQGRRQAGHHHDHAVRRAAVPRPHHQRPGPEGRAVRPRRQPGRLRRRVGPRRQE